LERTVWTNWAGNQSFKPARFESAFDESQVTVAVQRASRESQSIRTAGNGHSSKDEAPEEATNGASIYAQATVTARSESHRPDATTRGAQQKRAPTKQSA
jgi:hypothetical protein